MSCLKEDLWDPSWYPNQAQCEEFPDNTRILTNVSIWRNQATNRPLSSSDIPDVYPWQPGLREAQRFCLTAVSPSLVLLRAGLGRGPLWTVFGWRGGDWWAEITTQCSPDRNSNMVILQNIKIRFWIWGRRVKDRWTRMVRQSLPTQNHGSVNVWISEQKMFPVIHFESFMTSNELEILTLIYFSN